MSVLFYLLLLAKRKSPIISFGEPALPGVGCIYFPHFPIVAAVTINAGGVSMSKERLNDGEKGPRSKKSL